ncbi:MAG: threonine aldolase [Planctomycetota bacterium]|jgi:threonine aldolase
MRMNSTHRCPPQLRSTFCAPLPYAETMDTQLEQHRRDLRRASRWLHGDGFEPAHREMERIAAWVRSEELEWDTYGSGERLQAFEAHVAAKLGYPAARFLPSGSMAQPIALRLWSERAQCSRFGMHPTCHLELHEQRGYSRLHGLDATLIGPAGRPMISLDLAAVRESLSALVIELPTRENGGQLPEWDQLVELCGLAHERGIKTHLDGARLWEAAAGYERPLHEICALFDSTYVSFYKGIGALAGAMLLGPQEFIDEAALWQRRQGGNLYSLLPNWASAAMRFDKRLERFGAYRAKAVELALAMNEVDGLAVNPCPPQVNMFHVRLRGDAQALAMARDQVAQETGLWLFRGTRNTLLPDTQVFELYVGESALGIGAQEAESAFRRLFEIAASN